MKDASIPAPPDASATLAAALTALPQPTPTTSPAAAEPLPRFAGTGHQASDLFSLSTGLYIFRLEHAGDRNFIVHLVDERGRPVETLVNEIGHFSGSQAVQIQRAGNYLLNIDADGDWSISMSRPDSPPSHATLADPTAPPVTLQSEKRIEEDRYRDEQKRIAEGCIEEEWSVIDVHVKQLERATLEAADAFELFSEEQIKREKMHLDPKPQFFQTARDRFREGSERYDHYISREAARRGLTESHMQTTAEVEHARKTVKELIDWACWHPLLREPCRPLREGYADSLENWRLPSSHP